MLGLTQQIVLILLNLIVLLHIAESIDIDLTFIIVPGNRECFHQRLESGSELEFEYQVIEGGELDINFMMRSPSNKLIASDVRKLEGFHTINVEENGDHLFCFDNTFSRVSEKVVYFEMYSGRKTDDDFLDTKANWENLIASEQLLEMKLEDIEISLDAVKDTLRQSQSHQRSWRNIEYRDRHISEKNFSRVNFWSAINTVVMVVTAVIQVIMIRNLFADRRKTRT